MATENQVVKTQMLAQLNDRLGALGFRKSGASFHRELGKGLFHVIDFRLGRSWSITNGKVQLNWGVFTEEWYAFLRGPKRPKRLTSADCELRDCYCGFVDLNGDRCWYQLSLGPERVTADVMSELEHSILPYLDKYRHRDQILDAYHRHGADIGLPPRHKLSIAVLLLGLGRAPEAIDLAAKEWEANKENWFYERVFRLLEVEAKKATA